MFPKLAFGFMRNQVTPLFVKCETLYAWHTLPIELYRKRELALIAEPSGFV